MDRHKLLMECGDYEKMQINYSKGYRFGFSGNYNLPLLIYNLDLFLNTYWGPGLALRISYITFKIFSAIILVVG